MSFISELKRRNVFRVATAYVVVGWLLLQVADIVLDFTEAPAWIGKLLIGLLAIGFVVALALSWLFDVTPEGVRRDDGTTAVDPVRAQRLNIITIAAAVSVAGLFAWQQMGGSSRDAVQDAVPVQDMPEELVANLADEPPEIDVASVAVLPFADLSPDGDQEYFSDGIAEEILNVLTRVEGLAVASRTSAFAFKGQDQLGIPAIGDALQVRHVLEGSVRSAGDTIRITAQLIDASTDKHLWSQTYDRRLSAETVFEIQDEIATAIVAEMARLLPTGMMTADTVAVRADTESLDAYQLFLQGRQRFRVRSRTNIPGTIEIFERAVALDPEFARAWAGLAAIRSVAPSWGFPGEGVGNTALAVEAAETALSLDDSLALPYAVLGSAKTAGDKSDFAAAMDKFSEALARDPDEVNALLWRGIHSIRLGFFENAINDLSRCRALDPAYENCTVFEAQARLFHGDRDEAMRLFELTVATNSPSQAMMFGLAKIADGEKLVGQLTLAWGFATFDIPIEPELVYRSMTDERFDPEKEWRAYVARQKMLTGTAPTMADAPVLAPIIFKRYDAVRPTPNNMFWWHPHFPEFLASPHRKRVIRELGLPQYWRERGFPPQCRAVGDDDFECD